MALHRFFFFALAAVLFFIPVSMVAAELATGWPQTGGVFAWVKEAFGHRTGFLAIWLLWAENVIYYPALLSFIAGTIAYIASPTLAQNPYYTLFVIVTVFWATTAGESTRYAYLWLDQRFWGNHGDDHSRGTHHHLGNSLVFFWKLFASCIYCPEFSSRHELSHATCAFFRRFGRLLRFRDVCCACTRRTKSSKKTTQEPFYYRLCLILGLYVLGVLAIAIVIPQSEISLTAGSLQAFAVFVDAYGLSWLTPVIAILLTLGAFGTLSTWIAGPSKGLLGAASKWRSAAFLSQTQPSWDARCAAHHASRDCDILLDDLFNHAHCKQRLLGLERHGSPALLLMYILMFAAAIKLRYKQPQVKERTEFLEATLVCGLWQGLDSSALLPHSALVSFLLHNCKLATQLSMSPSYS